MALGIGCLESTIVQYVDESTLLRSISSIPIVSVLAGGGDVGIGTAPGAETEHELKISR